MATGRPVAKTWIKYKGNNLKENNEEEKRSINIKLTEQKSNTYNYENAIDLKLSDAQEEDKEDIALANFNESLQKQTDEENFQKSNWMIVWWMRYHTLWKEN